MAESMPGRSMQLLIASLAAAGATCAGAAAFAVPLVRAPSSAVARTQALTAKAQPPLVTQSRLGTRHGLSALAAAMFAMGMSRHRQVATSRFRRFVACAASAVGLEGPKLSIVVFGATGYIGRAVVEELMARGHSVTAFTRQKSGIKGDESLDAVKASFSSSGIINVVEGDVTREDSISSALSKLGKVDGVVCCLASRSGGKQDSMDIDYQATVNCHSAAKAAGASQFVLLSAICVQKPLLAFQDAKLKAEAHIKETSGDMAYSLVQPTAFFKSLLGQVNSVKGGSPYVMFGDGSIACKPISEEDLAAFIGDCFWDPAKRNATLPVGGPGKAMTFKEQGTLLFELQGKDPFLVSAPVALFDVINGFLDFIAGLWPEKLADIAEYGKIGKYYATECMLVLDKEKGTYREDLTPSYGRTTLKEFLTEALQEGSTKMESQQLGAQGVGDRLGISSE